MTDHPFSNKNNETSKSIYNNKSIDPNYFKILIYKFSIKIQIYNFNIENSIIFKSIHDQKLYLNSKKSNEYFKCPFLQQQSLIYKKPNI